MPSRPSSSALVTFLMAAAIGCTPSPSATETGPGGDTESSSGSDESGTASEGCPVASEGCPCAPANSCLYGLACVNGICEVPYGEEDSTTGQSPCQTHEDCAIHEDAVLCDQGQCLPCQATSNITCAEAFPDMPYCHPSGNCGECLPDMTAACVGGTPICDPDSNHCVACEWHSQCGEAGCNKRWGDCMDGAVVVHVDGDGGRDHATIAEALAATAGEPVVTVILHELDQEGQAYEPVTIDADVSALAILAAPSESPLLRGANGLPALTISGFQTVYLEGLQLRDGADSRGLLVEDAMVWVERCVIVNNALGAIEVLDGELIINNSFIGGDIDDVNSIRAVASQLDFNYSSLFAGDGAARVFWLEDSQAVGRNSIALSVSPFLLEYVGQSSMSMDHSLIEYYLPVPLTMDSSWLIDFAGGDFHIAAVQPFMEGLALYGDEDPPLDIDGQPRGGADPVPGADAP